MTTYTSIDTICPDQWKELLDNSSTSTFFQTPECYRFYDSLSFLKPFVFGVSEAGKLVGIICGYLIADGNPVKHFFSRRAIVPGGLLLAPNISEKAVGVLLETARNELSKRAIYIELRNYNDYGPYRETIEKAGFAYQPHLNFHIAAPDVETARKNLSTTKRRDVKLSEKNGVNWSEACNVAEVASYYEILENLYKTRIKTPLFPFEFFEKLIKLPHGKLFIVKYEGQVIGGSVCVTLPGRAVYEWFVCGLDGQTKNVFPSTVATWAGIEYAGANGFNRFDMMGAGKPDEGYGVREFKSKFGGELVEHGRFLCVCQPNLYNLGKFIVKKMKSKK